MPGSSKFPVCCCLSETMTHNDYNTKGCLFLQLTVFRGYAVYKFRWVTESEYGDGENTGVTGSQTVALWVALETPHLRLAVHAGYTRGGPKGSSCQSENPTASVCPWVTVFLCSCFVSWWATWEFLEYYGDVENGGGNRFQALWLVGMTTRSSGVPLTLERAMTSLHDDQYNPPKLKVPFPLCL